MAKSIRKVRARYFVAGTAAYLTALTILWPATFLDQKISAATGGSLRLVNASGTLWSGHGALEVRHQGKALAQSIPLSWHFQPGTLIQAELGFSVFIEGAPHPAPLRIGFSSLELRDFALNLPASALSLAADKLVALEPRGDLLLRVDRMVVGGKQPATDMQIEWRHAASGLTDVSPLGDYRIQCLMRDSKVSVVMETLKGPLMLEGRGSWAEGSPPVFKGTAKITAELQTRMTPMLRLFATERGAGEFDIRLN